MAGVELHNICKSYGAIDIVQGVDLAIEEGEFCVFVGPSGCGKSTLLRMIAGLEAISSGALSICGEDMTNQAAADRGVAMVFQSYALYPHMNVEQNMSFGLKINKYPKAEIAARVAKAARALQLEHLLQRKPKQLSGGQRQRVAIGRAIVRDPKVFLFDEPLSNLDAELRVQMRLEIARLHRELGATMVYVTHDQVEAMTLADKIVVLRAGKIEQVGVPLALYNDPKNLFVAGFIGSPKMNFLRADYRGHSPSEIKITLSDYPDVSYVLPIKATGLDPKTPLLLGIRPEHLHVHQDLPNNGDVNQPLEHQANLAVKIDTVENLGSSAFAYSAQTETAPIAIDLQQNRNFDCGDIITLMPDLSRAFLFNAVTGERI